MKKSFSLILAMVSTLLLIAGATQAAEKLDPLAQGNKPQGADAFARSSGMPCEIVPDEG